MPSWLDVTSCCPLTGCTVKSPTDKFKLKADWTLGTNSKASTATTFSVFDLSKTDQCVVLLIQSSVFILLTDNFPHTFCQWHFFTDENETINKNEMKMWGRDESGKDQTYGYILLLMSRKIRHFVNCVEQQSPVKIQQTGSEIYRQVILKFLFLTYSISQI